MSCLEMMIVCVYIRNAQYVVFSLLLASLALAIALFGGSRFLPTYKLCLCGLILMGRRRFYPASKRRLYRESNNQALVDVS